MFFSVIAASNSRVYLDHNATTPISSVVAGRIPAWLMAWGNPSSIHWSGREPKAIVRDSRQMLAEGLDCHSLELIFTSGGTEANNLALRGALSALKMAKGRPLKILSTRVEHPSVSKTLQDLVEKDNHQLFYVEVDRSGSIDLDSYKQILQTEQIDFVSIQLANNETGTLFPIRRMVEKAHQVGALFHSDCVQALGKIPVNLKQLGVDYATFSAHKFYALKGCGLLYVKKSSPLHPQITGGGQERHRRGGTENALAIAAFGEMARFLKDAESMQSNMLELRNYLEDKICREISGVTITGGKDNRLPNTSSLVIDRVDGETLLINLDMAGFSVSTGAACSSGSPEPSPVLLAMGLSRTEAQSSLRLSLGWENTFEEIDHFVKALKTTVDRLRSFEFHKMEEKNNVC